MQNKNLNIIIDSNLRVCIWKFDSYIFFLLQEQQYAKWMAACRLAAKGRTLADASYESEVNSITAFLQLQRPAPAPAINPNALDIIPEDYVASRFAKKFKGKVK